MGSIEVIPEMLIPISFFTLVFGIAYIRNKENMALIDRGINPRNSDQRPKHFVNLKWGLLLAGAGMGLLAAYFIDYNTAQRVMAAGKYDGTAIYFSLIAMGGGIGLILSYFIEKKYWDGKEGKQ